MTFLVHLSDLHMTRSDRAQARLFDKLLEALSAEHRKAQPERTTVFITGDVFDSATDPPAPLVGIFLDTAPQRIALAEETRVPLAPLEPNAASSAPTVANAARVAAMSTIAPLPPSRPFDLGLPSAASWQGSPARTRQAALFDSTSQSPLLAPRKDPIAEILMLPPRRPQ